VTLSSIRAWSLAFRRDQASAAPEVRALRRGLEGIESHREPWNKGKLVGQKSPLELKDIWAIRVPRCLREG